MSCGCDGKEILDILVIEVQDSTGDWVEIKRIERLTGYTWKGADQEWLLQQLKVRSRIEKPSSDAVEPHDHDE